MDFKQADEYLDEMKKLLDNKLEKNFKSERANGGNQQQQVGHRLSCNFDAICNDDKHIN